MGVIVVVRWMGPVVGCPVSVLVAEAYGPSQEEVLSSCRHGEPVVVGWICAVRDMRKGSRGEESRVGEGKD